MKILYSHRTRSADGQYVHIRELTNALRSRGHDIVMTGPDGAEENDARSLNAADEPKLRKFIPAAVYEFAELAYSVPAYWRLRGVYAREKPDVVYQRYNLFYYPGVWLKLSKDVPLILEVNAPLAEERAAHGGLAMKNFARQCEMEIWKAADMVLPVSEVLAEKVRDAGIDEEKIAVIHNGVTQEFLAAHDGNSVRRRYDLEGKLVLGFAGFVRDWHGADRVIRFLAAQKRVDLHFLLVGDGPARAGLEALAAGLGVLEQVTFTGVVQRVDVADHVAAFDVALQPAVVSYASPLKLFEYMALGVAILAPDQANIREVLTGGNDALLFDPHEPGAFEKSLETLCADEVLRNHLGAAARETLVRKDYTWEGNARRIEDIAARLSG
jgi:glycosyltransferase involved in cell wall biosynthesis